MNYSYTSNELSNTPCKKIENNSEKTNNEIFQLLINLKNKNCDINIKTLSKNRQILLEQLNEIDEKNNLLFIKYEKILSESNLLNIYFIFIIVITILIILIILFKIIILFLNINNNNSNEVFWIKFF